LNGRVRNGSLRSLGRRERGAPRSGLLGALCATVLCTACSDSDIFITKQIEFQLNGSGPHTIDLAKVGPRGWERVCVLAPYSTNASARAVLGFDWDAERRTSIATDDGSVVLVFVKDNRVLSYTQHPRSKGDFATMQPVCVPAAKARLATRADSAGRVSVLGPESRPVGSG
jgi:hypothetical protein